MEHPFVLELRATLGSRHALAHAVVRFAERYAWQLKWWFHGQLAHPRTSTQLTILSQLAISETSGQSNLTKKGRIAAAHVPFSRIRQVASGEPPSNTCFLGPTRVHNPNGISIGSAIFAGHTIVTDRQAHHHAAPSVTTGRTSVRRCGL